MNTPTPLVSRAMSPIENDLIRTKIQAEENQAPPPLPFSYDDDLIGRLKQTYTQELYLRMHVRRAGREKLQHDHLIDGSLILVAEWWEMEEAASKETFDSGSKPVRPSWEEYFFGIAREVSKRATCPRASIGVVIVSKDHHILSTGFNGAPAGKPHCTDVGCTVFAEHCVRSVHAEVNAVESARAIVHTLPINLSAPRPRGFLEKHQPVAYVVGPRDVCSHCAKTMYEAGVTSVLTRE